MVCGLIYCDRKAQSILLYKNLKRIDAHHLMVFKYGVQAIDALAALKQIKAEAKRVGDK